MAGLDNVFELLTIGADFSQFVSLSKNIADEKLFEKILLNQEIMIKLLLEIKGDNDMKILTKMIDKANDTLEEIEWYAEKALHYKTEHKPIADVYNKIADMHITIYDMLHKQMVDLIDEHRRMGHTPPPEMLAIWEYEHEKLIKEFTEAKVMVEEYKKSY
jgi:uncharacterized protein YjgD (DUF1641 family)